MIRFVLHRLALAIPTLFGVAVLVFLMLRVVPGDIVEIKLRGDGGQVTQEMIDKERHRLGLDRPLTVQFATWLEGFATGDLGISMWTDRPVSVEIKERLELTVEVAVLAAVIATVTAIPLGTLAALLAGSSVDYLIRLVTLGGLAAPAFWVGMLIILGLLDLFQWMPPMTFVPIYRDPLHNLSQLIFPALAIGYRFAAVVTRMTRSAVLEVLREDYIRTARAKGVYERLVVTRHAIPNALLPTINVIGLEFAFLIGGLVVTEEVFNLNGIGRLFVQAVSRNDFVLIQTLVLIIAAVFVLTNLAVDIICAALDPRLRLGRER
jgi:peptide/nickel transport system permease protein